MLKSFARHQIGICDLCGLPYTHGIARWCLSCAESLFDTAMHCSQCGLPLGESAQQCGECLNTPPNWQHLVCLGDYQAPLSHYIAQLKYQGQFPVAKDLAQLLMMAIKRAQVDEVWPEALISVPMHWRRRWRRGYNHSDLLAQALSKQLVIPYMPKALVKNRMTPTQQGQNRLQRQSNLRGTFTFGTLPSNIRHVAIVDDVVTTGSTILEITHLLHEHGVKLVDVYCLCRTSAGQM